MQNAIEPPSIDASLFGLTGQISDASYIYLIVIFILLGLSAFVSGSESAFFSLKPKDNAALKDDPSAKAKNILKLLAKPQELLATILIFNNFVNVGIVILSSFLLNDIFPKSDDFSLVRFIVEVLGITLVILLFGEVIPKIFANRNALLVTKVAAYPLRILSKIPPISWLKSILVKGTHNIQQWGNQTTAIDQNELEQAVALTKAVSGSEEEQRILEGIVKFGKTEASQIMTPRIEVEDIEATENFSSVLAQIIEVGYSRIPVFKNSPDNIIGILYIKDLLNHIDRDDSFNWKEVLREPYFVPENKKINDLLQEFRNMKMHMAVVVDEYGGASGIVTLEDILEEIVGDITDEFDDTEISFSKPADNTYIFEGRTSLLDLNKILGEKYTPFIEQARGEAETLGGLIVEVAGRILKNNEFIVSGPLKFIVVSSDKKRVKSIKIVVDEKN